MDLSLFKTLGALTIIGLGASLSSTSAFASDAGRDHRYESHTSRCAHLPRDARCVTYRGERCWESSGCYYRSHPDGGYVIIERPAVKEVVEKEVIEKPVVVEKKVVVEKPVYIEKKVVIEKPVVVEKPVYIEKKVVVERPVVEKEVVEEEAETQYESDAPVLEEESTVVETLPAHCKRIVIHGERCWEHSGVFYRHCEGGYRVCHTRGGHVAANKRALR